MKGYWQNPEGTAEMLWKDAAGVTWLRTGDLGYLDEDGYVFLVDRKKDLIKPNGMQVWPRELEEAIATYPAVRSRVLRVTAHPRNAPRRTHIRSGRTLAWRLPGG